WAMGVGAARCVGCSVGLVDVCVEDAGLDGGAVLHLDEDAIAAGGGEAVGEGDGRGDGLGGHVHGVGHVGHGIGLVGEHDGGHRSGAFGVRVGEGGAVSLYEG